MKSILEDIKLNLNVAVIVARMKTHNRNLKRESFEAWQGSWNSRPIDDESTVLPLHLDIIPPLLLLLPAVVEVQGGLQPVRHPPQAAGHQLAHRHLHVGLP